MKSAAVIAFPSESVVPVSNADLWVMGLEYTIPTLDPMFAIVRERGKPARTVRMEPEPPPAIHAVGGRLP